ncbi:MAG: ABC transporter ATP-binding protein [Xanthobacteraceae bacterium]
MTAILRAETISRRFGGYLALNNASCEVAAGQVHALIGPNGAGKTTLFNVVSGVLRPTSGQVSFDGTDYTGQRPDKVLAMGIARNFQQVRLVRGLSVVENVMIGCHARMNGGVAGNLAEFFGAGSAERAAREKARAMLDFVGMSGKGDVPPDELTLVDQRRLEIARALASEPRLLLLDEPAAGMNPTELMELSALIKRMQAHGMTVLLVEHHMRLVMSIADCITVLSAGNVIANGPPLVIQRDPTVISAYLGTSDASAFHS